jgi:hypothetical protein
MKRPIANRQRNAENPRLEAFLADVWAVCEKHGLAISPNDPGAFEVVEIGDEGNSRRIALKESLMGAIDVTADPGRPVWSELSTEDRIKKIEDFFHDVDAVRGPRRGGGNVK